MPAAARPRLCRVGGRDTWHIYDARRRISTGCTSRAEAELVLSRYLNEIEQPQLKIVSVTSILDRYIENRRERKIPGLFAALTEARAMNTIEHVIEWAGQPVARIKHAFHDAAARAGLVGVTPHCLRHTAVTWQLQAGVPVWEVAGFVGMDAQMVQEVYGHHHSEHTRRASKALG
jgi:hypothetical protein